jgi:enamine deaminase RidA (YjgF/YER057c/UK114 family)
MKSNENDSIDQRLVALGISLPRPPDALGAYRATVRADKLLFVSGQLPVRDGIIQYKGRVGAELTLAQGREAAALAILNALAQIRRALGGFADLAEIVRLEGHVASAPNFYDQPKVLDGASDLLTQLLGDRAGHARSAFGPARLPANAAVELVVIAALRS